MRTALSRSLAPTVRLPDDTSTRRIEALHELAWRDLLDLQPGTTQALIDRAATQARGFPSQAGKPARTPDVIAELVSR